MAERRARGSEDDGSSPSLSTMTDEERLDLEIADAVMERPYPFYVGRKQFFLYPVTLGKMYLLQRLIDDLGIDYKTLKLNMNIEMLRLATEEKRKVCTILAYHTCKNKEQIHSRKIITERTNLFVQEASTEDLASILIILLTKDKADVYMKHLGIDKELERLKKVSAFKSKSSENTLSFGGKSIYGSFIAPLIEMGLSYEEIVWERSYTNLRMLLADKVNSVYLTDEELKKLPNNLKLSSTETIDASDPNNSAQILAAFANRGIKIKN